MTQNKLDCNPMTLEYMNFWDNKPCKIPVFDGLSYKMFCKISGNLVLDFKRRSDNAS